VCVIVCVCANVSERKLRATIAGGATTLKEIERRCGAGAGCGACHPLIRQCVKECRAAAAAPARELATSAPAELAPA
jgi:bacterioferritin-associated ferredoxin